MARSVALIILISSLLSLQSLAGNIEAGVLSYLEEDQISVLGVKKDLNTIVYGFNFTSTWIRKGAASWFLSAGLGRANSEQKNDDVTFNQSNLLAYWGMIGPSWKIIDDNPDIAISWSLPLMYRVIQYQIPATSTEFPNRSRLMPGVGVDLVWAMSRSFVLTQRMTFGLGVKGSSLWQAGVRWRF